MKYLLTTTKANYDQGILNIPTQYSDFFGSHGSQMTLQIEDRQPITRTIDRNNVKNRSPRISTSLLKEYFREKGVMGSKYEVLITKNHITITPY